MEGAVDAGTAENKKSISLHSPSSEKNLNPCGMTFTPSAPGNTIGICHLPSGGGSALNQTQSLTSRCNLGNTFPGQGRAGNQSPAHSWRLLLMMIYGICVLLGLYFPATLYNVLVCISCWPPPLLLFCTSTSATSAARLMQLHQQGSLHRKQPLKQH